MSWMLGADHHEYQYDSQQHAEKHAAELLLSFPKTLDSKGNYTV